MISTKEQKNKTCFEIITTAGILLHPSADSQNNYLSYYSISANSQTRSSNRWICVVSIDWVKVNDCFYIGYVGLELKGMCDCCAKLCNRPYCAINHRMHRLRSLALISIANRKIKTFITSLWYLNFWQRIWNTATRDLIFKPPDITRVLVTDRLTKRALGLCVFAN